MTRQKTREEIIRLCEMASLDMGTFYKADFINYRGRTRQKELYTEIIAEWLLNHFEVFDKIKTVERSKSYRDDSHDCVIKNTTNRKEEITAKQLFNSKKSYAGFGTIIDYQIPLKNPGGKNNDGLGKIDLLSVNKNKECVFLLELKKEDSKETLLRCALEAYTYLKIVSKEKLFTDFKDKGIRESFTLKASPLVYENGVQYEEYKDNSRNFLHKLMIRMDCIPFFLKEKVYFDVINL